MHLVNGQSLRTLICAFPKPSHAFWSLDIDHPDDNKAYNKLSPLTFGDHLLGANTAPNDTRASMHQGSKPQAPCSASVCGHWTTCASTKCESTKHRYRYTSWSIDTSLMMRTTVSIIHLTCTPLLDHFGRFVTCHVDRDSLAFRTSDALDICLLVVVQSIPCKDGDVGVEPRWNAQRE